MAKKLKIKKKFKIIFFLFVLLIIGIIFGINKYNELEYQKTYEYKFLQLGYTDNEINILLDNFNNEKLNELVSNDKDELIFDIINEKYYIKEYFEEYYNYINEEKIDNISDAITIINTNIDEYYYEYILDSDLSKNELVLVNKYYSLDENYTPELITISTKYSWGTEGSQKTTQKTYDAFLDMWNAAYSEEEIYLMVNSSYRSYDEQDSVYTEYKNDRGEKYADGIAARAGHSEHQTGLALDIFSLTDSSQGTLADSPTYAWLKDNCYKYGFILRYPEDKEDITGYNFESWHYRYVGIDVATYIYENDITFDEYYAYYLN